MIEKIGEIPPGKYKFVFWVDQRKVARRNPQNKNTLSDEWLHVSPLFLFRSDDPRRNYELIELTRAEMTYLSTVAKAFLGLCRMSKNELTFEKHLSKGITEDIFSDAYGLGAKFIKPEEE